MCRALLTALPTGEDPAAVIGEECHIVARSEDGPRGDEPRPREGVDSYANLILLCPSDHRRIDAQPRSYSARRLHEIKAQHERWAAGQLARREIVVHPAVDADPLATAASVISEAVWDVLHDPAYRLWPRHGVPLGVVHGRAVKAVTRPVFEALGRAPADDRLALATFLDSDEVRQLVAQVYRDRIARTPRSSLARDLRMFWAGWHLDVVHGIEPPTIANALLSGWNDALPWVVGDASVNWEPSDVARQLTDERLAGLESALEIITTDPDGLGPRADALQQALRRYAAVRYGDLDSASVDTVVRIPMRELYVMPQFRVEGSRLSYDEVVQSTFRLVVVGNPGAGKSAFAARVCLDLATGVRTLSGGLRPVGIIVRSYRVARRIATPGLTAMEALRTAVEDVIRDELQVNYDPEALEYLLRAGRVALVFDGVDELSTSSGRVAVRDAVDEFVVRYPQVPTIVTARSLGYDTAPLDPTRFRLASITSFDEAGVADYAQRWFTNAVEDPHQAASMAQRFVLQTGSVRDLRSSPLLLSALCAIYLRRGQIPSGFGDVVETLAELLYSRWDRVRGLDGPPESEHIRSAIERLAWVMVGDSALASGMSAVQANNEIASHFVSQGYVDSEGADEMAAAMIVHLRGRGGVLSEVGFDHNGDGLFGFVHRTFQEYFAASYLANETETIVRLARETIRLLTQGEPAIARAVAYKVHGRANRGVRELLDAMRAEATTSEEQTAVGLYVEWALGTLQ